jgi:hypothetical protein
LYESFSIFFFVFFFTIRPKATSRCGVQSSLSTNSNPNNGHHAKRWLLSTIAKEGSAQLGIKYSRII